MRRWARWINRTHRFWVCVWPLLAVAVWLPAPRLSTLLAGDTTDFIPQDMPSKQAAHKLADEFPDYAYASRVVLVFARDGRLTSEDQAAIARLARALEQQQDSRDWRVRAVATNPLLRPFLESADGQASLVVIELPADMLTHHTVERVRNVRRIVEDQDTPAGLAIELTGSGALGELLDANAKRDVNATTLWVFASVATVLLIVYRSPVAMLLPVVTIGLSLMMAMGLIGWAAGSFLPINGLVEMFIVVIVAGTGVDYCLFLFARFREGLDDGLAPPEAVERAVSRTGGAILASAGTNAAAFAMMLLARNRDFYTSGPTIAFAIVVGTFAVLTLTPSLMRLFGRSLLWPRTARSTRPSAGAIWSKIAHLTTERPLAVTLIVTGLLAVPALTAINKPALFDAIEEYPASSSFVRGARLYEKHFWRGDPVVDISLLIPADRPTSDEAAREAYDLLLTDLAATLARDFPIAYQRDLGAPFGRQRPSSAGEDADGLSNPVNPMIARLMQGYFLGRSEMVTRIDLGLSAEPRSARAIQLAAEVRNAVVRFLQNKRPAFIKGDSQHQVYMAGESATYGDIRALRSGDFRRVGAAALAIISLIVLVVVRSLRCTALLMGATLLTYLAAYGFTWQVFTTFAGVEGLNYQLDFLLFIIIVSLGQDYNIYVVSRIREEMEQRPVRDAVAEAVRRTGRVVSSCGVIMACAFGSMFSGSLLIMKEFAVALAAGMLIDTFLVRPLLVPAAFVLLHKTRPARGSVD